MTNDLVEKLRGVTKDRDNFPRMRNELHLPIHLAAEAADKILALQNQVKEYDMALEVLGARIFADYEARVAYAREAQARIIAGGTAP